ncbi:MULTISPECIES: hypothetical protein [unclassified Mesobacillus]|uniref:hypothetical protein n=1 Tax=unclassified Mesobacillus TaxID=2675270 RepID=UPI00203D0CB5|nr:MULTISPECIES: hypothetical protein [unclassified Mesobacillus]MCM3124797.1 hypothetical protein [Mesobacillus sp. MER 33]MCM3232894.1 hypothetical protein [Mesobacillus sp. MER 48]
MMIIFTAYIFLSLTVLLLVSILLLLHHRGIMSGMNGMMFAMYFGMNTGLTSGILLGAIYRGDLFSSTLLSILIGGVSGCILGASYNTLTSIEGLMSGIMGGMMGAMLGEMLPPEKSFVFINIFLAFSLSSLFLFKVHMNHSSVIKSLKDLIKPAIVFILLTLYLLSGNLLEEQWIHDLQHSPEQQHEMHLP